MPYLFNAWSRSALVTARTFFEYPGVQMSSMVTSNTSPGVSSESGRNGVGCRANAPTFHSRHRARRGFETVRIQNMPSHFQFIDPFHQVRKEDRRPAQRANMEFAVMS